MIKGQELGSDLSTKGITQDNVLKLTNSKQHYEYSINGSPNMTGKPSPSRLDLDGKKPETYLSKPHL